MIAGKLIGIAGAGSIGCFVGGMLAAAGRPVGLLARPRVIQEIEDNGLRLTGFEGAERQIAPDRLKHCRKTLQFLPMPAWCWSPSRAPIPPGLRI